MFSAKVYLAVAVLITLYHVTQKRRSAKLPPGPPPLPIIGNLHQAPTDTVWVTFEKWTRQYGPLVSVNFGGTTVILIADYDIARDLMDKRGSVYSSRPRMVMASELTCEGKHILLRPYNEQLILHQRLESPVLSPRASACYTPLQDMESKVLLKALLSTNDFVGRFECFAASIVYTLTYGFRVVTGDEWQVRKSHDCTKNFTKAGQVGVWMVDALPALNYLPEALAPWKKTAKAWHREWDNLHLTNMREALKREGWNWTKDFNNAREAQGLSDSEIAWDLGILADAGVETTGVALQVFVLACLAYPDFIHKAQKELDEVVGSKRVPGFEDLDRLPYIQAVVEENFRWRHIIPNGVPHATTQDDYYNGYLIPRGSTIVPLFHAMRKDEKLFDSPLDFRPERWLGKSQPGNWGYGRRVCTGRFIAKNSLNIVIARMLWAFDISSKDGKRPLVEESMFTQGFVSAPKPFEAVFTPRSAQHKRVVEESFDAVEKDAAKILEQIRSKMVAVGLNPRA
jgi:cytochrome P450